MIHDQNPHSVPFSLCLAAVLLHLTQNCSHFFVYFNTINGIKSVFNIMANMKKLKFS